MNRVYLLPFNQNLSYVDAYKVILGKRVSILSGDFVPLKLLFLPLRARIIIEDVHIYWYLILLRFDLVVIHIPRGGCTFKIGWKDSDASKRIKVKLWRRNYIVIASDFFVKFFKDQEFILKNQKLLIHSEPLLEININSYDFKVAEKTLLILGDRATKEDYDAVIDRVPDLIKEKLVVTVHPRLNFRVGKYPSNYAVHEIKNVISDGSVSSIIMFSKIGANIFILGDCLHSRPLWLEKGLIYENMVMLEELSTAIEINNTSILKIDVSTDSITNVF
jgi:hypothetical protein